MALPIRATPVLKGKDAKRFRKMLEENENRTVSEEEITRVLKAYLDYASWAEYVNKKHLENKNA